MRRGRGGMNVAHQPIADQCREAPGTWVRVRSYRAPSSAADIARCIRSGRLPAYAPAGSFEAEVRRETRDADPAVYARFIATEGSTTP